MLKAGFRYGDSAAVAVIEFVDRDVEAKGQDSGPVQEPQRRGPRRPELGRRHRQTARRRAPPFLIAGRRSGPPLLERPAAARLNIVATCVNSVGAFHAAIRTALLPALFGSRPILRCDCLRCFRAAGLMRDRACSRPPCSAQLGRRACSSPSRRWSSAWRRRWSTSTPRRMVSSNRNPPFMTIRSSASFSGGAGAQQVQRSLGSGVIVDPAGLIVTNYHVIEGAERGQGRAVRQARVRRRDRAQGRAHRPRRAAHQGRNERLPVLDFADSDELEVGDLVLAIGDPFGVGQTVTTASSRRWRARKSASATISTSSRPTPPSIPAIPAARWSTSTASCVGINTRSTRAPAGRRASASPFRRIWCAWSLAAAKGGSAAVKRPWLGRQAAGGDARDRRKPGAQAPTGALVANVAPGRSGRQRRAQDRRPDRQHRRHAVDDPGAFNYRFATKPLGGTAQIAAAAARAAT